MSARLRPWAEGDETALAALFDDPLVYRFTPIQPPFDVVAARRRIAVATHGERSRSIICRAVLEAEELVGEVAAYARDPLDTGEAVVNVSYVIGSIQRGNGLAREATALLLREVQQTWSVRRAIAEIAPENPASRRVAESLGFIEVTDAVPTPRAGKEYAVTPWHLDLTQVART